jgi:hypothetical protein
MARSGIARVRVMQALAISAIVAVLGASSAHAWWDYAGWGLSEMQLQSASHGRAVPCRPDVPVCATLPDGSLPKLFVETLQIV